MQSQVIDEPANWPNTDWTVSGTYNTVQGFSSDPTTTPNFGFDDNLAGSASLFDVIAAESPVIDLNPAATASPQELEIVVEGTYTFAFSGDELMLQYWDQATHLWNDWDSLVGNSSTLDYENCSNLQAFTSQALNIASFSTAQKIGFKYRIIYNDNGHSFGMCVGSPRLFSQETALCMAVTAINADAASINFDSAVIDWNDLNSPAPQNGWEIEFGATGFVQGTGTTTTTTLNPYTITGLTPETCYDVYIRAVCDATISSTWTGPYNFCTTFVGPQCGGQFVDSGGVTGTYLNNEDIITTVSPDNAGEVVTAVFLSFNTENCCDNLKIYDGDSTASPLVGQYQGTSIPPSVEATLANGGSLTFEFHSDGSVVRDGWIANLFCGAPTTCFMTENLTATANISINTAEVTWDDTNATTPVFGWQVMYGPTGFDPDTAGTVVDATTNPFTITGLSSSTEYDFYVKAVCGANVGDDDSFWSGPSSFITLCDAIPAPYSQTFENGGLTPICWEQGAANGEDWLFDNDFTNATHAGNAGVVSGNTLSGGYFAWVDDSNPANTGTTLLSPFIDLAGIVNPTLGFYYASNDEFFNNHVDFSVDIWDGTTWVDDVFTSNTNTTGWEQVFVDLAAYNGMVIQARFVVDETSGFRDDMIIDDVYFGEMPTCINVNGITINNVGSTDVIVTWADGGNIPVAAEWQLEYGAPGFTQGSGTIVDVNTALPYTLTGLNAQTDYEFYVRSNCGAGDFSLWAGPVSFTTLCPIFDAPYTEDFEDGGVIDGCWNQSTNGDPWEYANTYFGHIGNGGDPEGTATASGGYFAFVDDSFDHTLNNSITTPLVDLTPLAGAPATLSFYYMSNNEGGTNVDFSVDVWDGAAWNDDVFTSSSNTAGWVQMFINLDLLTITGPVQARFTVDENNGNDFNDDLALDDVFIGEAPACYPISGLLTSGETENSVDLTWTDALNTPGIDYIIEYGPTGFAQGTGTSLTVSTNPYTVDNLTPDTDYDFYVRAACTTVDLSDWTNVAQATTLPTCLVVSGIAASNITTTGFDVNWTDNNVDVPLGGWDVEVVISTFPQGSGDTTTVNVTNTTITGLLPSSFYDIYIRANCASDDSDPSRWVGPITIQTTMAPPLNDACVDAIELAVTVDCEPILGNNLLSSETTPALATDCADPAVDGLEPGFVLDDVWYKFIMPATGTVIIQTAFAGGMEDSAVSVYTGACGALVPAVNTNGRDTCSDDADADLSAGTNADNNRFGIVQLINQTPGEEFYIRVWSVDRDNIGQGNVHGQFTICVFGQPIVNRSGPLETEEEVVETALNISYYPNPVKDTLTLKADDNINALSVYSVLGQQVISKTYTVANEAVSLDLQNLNSGTYFVKILVGDKTKTIKIIKK
ncbi:MAG: fibronectin type III domain-containing protein [Flavobacteriaceae bacterium]